MSFDTALQVAVLAGNETMVQLLLEAGADSNNIRGGLGTVLQISACKGNELIVKHLLEANSDVNIHCEGNFHGVRHPQNKSSLCNRLIFCAIQKRFYTALQAAVRGDCEKIVQLLLEAGADPNDSKEGWGTALQIAAFQGNELIAKRLLEANADANLHCEGVFGDVRYLGNEFSFTYLFGLLIVPYR